MAKELPPNAELIQKALDFAAKKHALQFRDAPISLPYLTHPLEVLKMLARWGVTSFASDIWVAALLHDTIEDTATTWDELAAAFGQTVADWVEHLSFRPKAEGEDSKAYQQAKSAHMAEFVRKPLECLLIKVADRCCNIHDFLCTDRKYAIKYYRRADGLWAALDADLPNIKAKFGKAVAGNVLSEKENLLFCLGLDN